MRNNMKLAAAVALVAVTAGCNLKAPATNTVPQETTFGGGKTPGSATTGSNGANTGSATNGSTVGANGSGTVGAGAATGGAAFDASKVPTQAQALAGAKAMNVVAQAGGMYRSADGTLTADIPPGALSGDTTIKISRVDTSTIPASDYYVPGIMFAVDLGGATLAPDTQIMVKAELDGRFVDEMKVRDPNFTPAAYNLTQVDGKWFMAMPVKGPSSTSSEVPLNANPTLGAWNLNEFGGFPLPGASTGANFGVQFVAGSYDYDSEEVRLSNGSVITAPKSQAQWHDMEARGMFGCGAFPHCYYYGKLATRAAQEPQRNTLVAKAKTLRGRIPSGDLAPKVKSGDHVTLNALPAGVSLGTASTELPSDKAITLGEQTADTGSSLTFRASADGATGTVTFNVTRTADVADLRATEDAIRALDAKADAAASDCNIVVTPAPIKTHTTWVSDDPALDGKDASGVTVRFSMLQNPVSGPLSVNSDKEGAAASAAQVGTAVTITPSITLGPVSGASVAIAALQANQGTTELKITKNSPAITLKLSSADQAMNGSVAVTYTLDGVEATKTLSATGKQANVTFFTIVPDDKAHTFALKSVMSGELSALKVPAGISVQRNGAYSQSVTLSNVAAK